VPTSENNEAMAPANNDGYHSLASRQHGQPPPDPPPNRCIIHTKVTTGSLIPAPIIILTKDTCPHHLLEPHKSRFILQRPSIVCLAAEKEKEERHRTRHYRMLRDKRDDAMEENSPWRGFNSMSKKLDWVIRRLSQGDDGPW
jgi:hypothetical protein